MRCAIYARRSTEEHQAASLEVQTDEARRWITARGWFVDDASIYTDSGVSRSEFKRRPGLIAMLNAAGRGEFDAVVVRDSSRLGGDMTRVALLIQDLVESGVQIWCYFTDERVQAESTTERLLVIVKAYADELEREKIAGRTREHLEIKARAGYNVGGRVYGYDNVPVMVGERRERVEYRINDAEAAVIRDVFEQYVAGAGLRAIAISLNARGVPSPRAGKRGTGSWSAVTVHDMLRRERYRGQLNWGWRGGEYRGGTRVEIRRPRDEWVSTERPELRIIDDLLWERVQSRIAGNKREGVKGGPAPRHLLSGIARCSVCGGPMQADSVRWGKSNLSVYVCRYAYDRGASVCTNLVRRPTTELDAAIIGWLRTNILRPEVVTAVIARAREIFEERQSQPVAGVSELESELRRTLAEIQRITTAIATTEMAPEALARAIMERESRARDLRTRIAAARSHANGDTPRWAELEVEARRRVGELSEMFAANVAEAREALRKVLRGPLICTPMGEPRDRHYRLSGNAVVPGLDTLEQGHVKRPQGDSNGALAPSIPFAFMARRVAA
jgi:DNA invertase Pin-like site-specific DNA recombinase